MPFRITAALFVLGAAGAFALYGADSVTVPLELVIPEANMIQIKDGPLSMTIPISPSPVRKTFSFVVTATGDRQRRLTAAITEPLPPGLVFLLEVSSPGMGRSRGPKALGPSETELLSGISRMWRKEMRATLTVKTDNRLYRSTGTTGVTLALR